MIKAGLLAAMFACGFVVGRGFPTSASEPVARRQTPDSRAGPALPEDQPAIAPGGSHMPSLRARAPVVADVSVPEEWVRLVRSDASAASWLRHAVLFELEERRRSATHIRECFDSSAIGEIDLRFRVDVEADRQEVVIGEPTFVEVANGMPVSPETTRCVADALAGRAVLTDGIDEAPTYAGSVDYVARFVFTSEPRELEP